MATTPQWKARRLAFRAVEALKRSKVHAKWLAAFDATLGVSAPAYIEAFDRLRGLDNRLQATVGSKHASAAALLLLLRGWVIVVCQHVPNLHRGTFGSNPNVPDDVISDVLHLISTVDTHEQQTGQKLFFSDDMRAELDVALTAAKADWGIAGDTAVEIGSTGDAMRTAYTAFNRDLIAFRLALEAMFGKQHADYQLLRASKIKEGQEGEEEEIAPPEVAPEGDAAAAI